MSLYIICEEFLSQTNRALAFLNWETSSIFFLGSETVSKDSLLERKVCSASSAFISLN